jgi:hypothetical protein
MVKEGCQCKRKAELVKKRGFLTRRKQGRAGNRNGLDKTFSWF